MFSVYLLVYICSIDEQLEVMQGDMVTVMESMLSQTQVMFAAVHGDPESPASTQDV